MTTKNTNDAPTPRPVHWLTPEVRRYGYGLLAAGITVATVYGYVTQEQATAWLSLALALTGLTTAAAHVPGRDQ